MKSFQQADKHFYSVDRICAICVNVTHVFFLSIFKLQNDINFSVSSKISIRCTRVDRRTFWFAFSLFLNYYIIMLVYSPHLKHILCHFNPPATRSSAA